MDLRNLAITLTVAVGLMGGFYFGFKYGQGHPPPSTAANGAASAFSGPLTAAPGASPSAGAGAGGLGGSLVTGQITAVGNGTITVHDRQTDKDVIVAIGANTTILQTTPATQADLKKDQTVAVTGPAGSDGTVQARAISIQPPGGGAVIGGGGGGRTRPSPTAST